MNKVVINDCHGGFKLSPMAIDWLKGKGVQNPCLLSRHNPLLVQCVEELGDKASGFIHGIPIAHLIVVEINSDYYKIDSYDGKENILSPDQIGWIKIELIWFLV